MLEALYQRFAQACSLPLSRHYPARRHPGSLENENPDLCLAVACASLAGMTAKSLIPLSVLLLLLLAPASFGQDPQLPNSEKQKIEALIKHVGDLKNAKFVRNGWTYEPSTAIRFLRGKWDAKSSEVHSARDFIDKVASMSGTSGKPYLIRFHNGKEIPSREFLLAALKKIK